DFYACSTLGTVVQNVLLFAFQVIEKGCRLHDILPYIVVCGEDTMLWRRLSIFRSGRAALHQLLGGAWRRSFLGTLGTLFSGNTDRFFCYSNAALTVNLSLHLQALALIIGTIFGCLTTFGALGTAVSCRLVDFLISTVSDVWPRST